MIDEMQMTALETLEATRSNDADRFETAASEIVGLPERALGMIRQLKDEANARTRELESARAALAAVESERAADRAQIDAAVGEIAALKPQAERAIVLETYIRDAVVARVDALPDVIRPLVPVYDDPLRTLDWLERSAAVLLKPIPPQMDAGARGHSKAARISEGEREIARKLGVSAEQYRAAKR